MNSWRGDARALVGILSDERTKADCLVLQPSTTKALHARVLASLTSGLGLVDPQGLSNRAAIIMISDSFYVPNLMRNTHKIFC